MDINDPKFCYIMDGVLLLYVILITVLYLRAKFSGPGSQEPCPYPEMNKSGDQYNQLEWNSMESSKAHRLQRKEEDKYMPLKSRTADTYREIHVKKEPRNKDFVYQDLRKATKDTYDSLQMQPLSPRR